ncbi:MAG: class II glutamine amidotransferase [Desulfobacterales bacterium]|jgi:predicted glutamine amidotransferase|nr:class II glutamine amidotransferase [Desulfobacterales bacterium]
MCDLFALSANRDYSAPKSLPIFAEQAGKNLDGWGIGYFRNHHAYVEKSAKGIFVAGQLHDSFQRLARVVKSRIIICHVRLRTSGLIDECHAHPFVLKIGGYDWIFAHNGKAPAIESYESRAIAMKEAVSDSARTFEFLRDHLTQHFQQSSDVASIFEALSSCTSEMIERYPGKYNFFLSNGQILFIFTNHRQFMLLKGSKKLEGALLITTVEKGLSDEKWLRIAKSTCHRGMLLAVSGTDIIVCQPL